MGILDELKQSANLKAYHDARRGSVLDYSGNGFTLTPAGSGHRFVRHPVKGTAFTGTSATALSATGVQTSLDLTTATLFYSVVMYNSNFPVPQPLIVSKANGASLQSGYTAYLSTNFNFALGDNVGFQAFSVGSVAPYVGIPVMVAHSWNGTNIVSYINGSQVDLRAQTKIPSPLNMTYQIGSMTNGIYRVGVLNAGMANRVLTGAEVARLYDDFLAEGPSPDLIRRNFVQVPQTYGSKDADYFSNVSTLVNGDFETGDPPTGWNQGGAGGTISRVAGARPGGTGSYVGQATNVTAATAYCGLIKPAYLVVGAVYRATGWCRVANAAANYLPFIQSGLSTRYWEGPANTSAWQYFDFTFRADDVLLYLYLQDLAKTPGNWVQYDDVQVFPLTCCLDTDFVRSPDGKIRDNAPNNYAGTVTGVVVPGLNGAITTSATSYVSLGVIAQLEAVSKFTSESIIKSPSPTIASTLFGKLQAYPNNVTALLLTGGGGGPSLMVSNGGVATATPGVVLRAGATQHIFTAFDGGAVGDANKIRIFVDGEQYGLSFAGAIPAVTCSGAASYNIGDNVGSAPAGLEHQLLRFTAGKTVTAAEVRQAYLKNFAQKVLLRETFEDVPVSLGVSATAGMYIGGWRVISGSWQCTETADGKRWLECIANGAIAYPQNMPWGTLVFSTLRANATYQVMQFQAQFPLAYTAATQNGYVLAMDSNQAVAVQRFAGGAWAANMFWTAFNYVTAGNSYCFAINRRPSDGRFTTYMRGVANWDLMSAAGGGGSNPSAAEATYTTSSWFVFNSLVGNKLLMWDPANKSATGCGLTVFQGQLNPLVGEIL